MGGWKRHSPWVVATALLLCFSLGAATESWKERTPEVVLLNTAADLERECPQFGRGPGSEQCAEKTRDLLEKDPWQGLDDSWHEGSE